METNYSSKRRCDSKCGNEPHTKCPLKNNINYCPLIWEDDYSNRAKEERAWKESLLKDNLLHVRLNTKQKVA